MKFSIRYSWITAFLSAFIVLLPRAGAMATMPLPDFEVTALDGRVVGSKHLSSSPKWLLIYVQPNCSPCKEVFRALERNESQPDLSGKIIVLVGGVDAEEAKRMARRWPSAPESSWYVDPLGRAAVELKLQGAPIVFGIHQDTIEWDLSGVPADSNTLKSILTTWCED